jgi:hypothetical protein
MKFYRVKKEADQTRFNNPLSGWHLVADELMTEKDVQKTKFSNKQIKKYFDVVEINKFNTYWLFGCRFERKLKHC